MGNPLKVDDAALAGITRAPLPGSRKIYLPGRLYPELRVPMREIAQTPTQHGAGKSTPNPKVVVYDTSGPFTDPEAPIDLRAGLPPLRDEWVRARGDVERLAAQS